MCEPRHRKVSRRLDENCQNEQCYLQTGQFSVDLCPLTNFFSNLYGFVASMTVSFIKSEHSCFNVTATFNEKWLAI